MNKENRENYINYILFFYRYSSLFIMPLHHNLRIIMTKLMRGIDCGQL